MFLLSDIAVYLKDSFNAVCAAHKLQAGRNDDFPPLAGSVFEFPLPEFPLAQLGLDPWPRLGVDRFQQIVCDLSNGFFLRIAIKIFRSFVPALDTASEPPNDNGIVG